MQQNNNFPFVFNNNFPYEWGDYVCNKLMKQALWTHYFLWEAVQIFSLLENVNIKDLNVLEPGCGNGVIGCLFSLLGAKVTLLDYSEDVIKNARIHSRNLGIEDKIRYIVGDMLTINLGEKFDIVFNDGVIEHFEVPAMGIKRMINFTKENGRVLVTVPAKYTFHTFLIRPYLRKKNRFKWDSWGREKSYSELELRKMLIDSGLDNVKVCTANLRRAFIDDNLMLPFFCNGPRRKKIIAVQISQKTAEVAIG